MRRFSEGTFYRPPLQSAIHGSPTNAQIIAPFGHCLCFAVKGNQPVISAVALLFFVRGPSAIFRAVAKIVVDPVELATSVPWPHVGVKVLKRLSPTLANGYSATAIS